MSNLQPGFNTIRMLKTSHAMMTSFLSSSLTIHSFIHLNYPTSIAAKCCAYKWLFYVSFSEIRRLEKSIDDQKHTSTRLEENVDDCKKAFGKLEGNLNDQKHMFTNNITNLHYQIKEVQSNVETLKE